MLAKLTRLAAVCLTLSLPIIPHAATAAVSAGSTANNSGATTSGSIAGTVKDPSGAVVLGARVTVMPGAVTVSTDGQGSFSLPNLAPGTYTVTVSYVGFGDLVSTLDVVQGKTTALNATLTLGSNAQQIEVSAYLTGDVAAINEQRTSENILNVQTDVQIQSLPNANIADVLGRMPSVTLQRNEGEGQYVQIRGTEPRLSNTTIDGVLVPGPDPQVRQVDLDTIPADLVGSVAINKTLSANQDGDAIGGSVDLRIKQATSDRPTLMISGIGGNTPIDNNRQVYTIASSAGFRFGPRNDSGTKKIGLELGYSYDANERGIDDIEPTPDLDSTGARIFDQVNVQQYLYDRTRYGFAGSLDYSVSPGSSLYAHGLFSNFRDYGQKYAYQVVLGDTSKYKTSVRRPNLQIEDLALGGNQVFDHSFLKYQVAISHSRFGGAAGNPGASLKGSDATGNCSYVPTASEFRPQLTCATLGDPVFDLANYTLKTIDLTTGQATQLNLQGNASFGLNYHLGSHASTLEIGGQFRNEHKGQDAYSPEYDAVGKYKGSQFLGTFSNPHFYGGSYPIAQVTSFEAITSDLANNPGNYTLDEPTTHQNSDAANYNLQERVTAGYIMNTLTLGKFHLQTGLRIEATQTSNTGYLVTTNGDGSYGGTTAQHGSGSYINPLPSVQLRYSIDSTSDIRAVYGRGISRPDPYQLVPYNNLTIGGSTDGSVDLVQVGNPALVAEHANDYDLLYEKYLPSVGVIQAGFFYKQITKPIFIEAAIVPATGSALSVPYAGDQSQQEVNGDHAYISGLEIAYQQHLRFLPGYLANARLDANFTYTNSKNYNLANRTDSPQLVGQAPYSWNVGPSYATKRALVSVGISHNSSNIYAYQYQSTGPNAVAYGLTGPNGDNYFFSHTQIDAQATYYIGKGFTVLASGLNMNNEVFGFFNGQPQYFVQREYYKPTYSGGIRWNLRREQ